MSSNFTSLADYVKELREFYIAEKGDYSAYTRQDQSHAIAYRILASASLESHVEDICRQAASKGISRAKRHQPSRVGQSLITWYAIKSDVGAAPLTDSERSAYVSELDKIQSKYNRLVDKSHGIDDKDLRALVFPLGCQESDLDIALLDNLKSLSEFRNPASHRRLNRAKSMNEPKSECDLIEKTLPLLRTLEKHLDRLAENS